MARIETEGIVELARELQRRGAIARPAAERMLKFAGEEVAKFTKVAAENHGLVDTGKMVQSIKSGPVQTYTDSGKVEVWPQGSATRGKKSGRRERNATIGFVQHYGRSYGRTKRAGTGFFDEGRTNSENAVYQGMMAIWREEEDNA